MAKYQLCSFWRAGREYKGNGTKAENPWERGIAKVKDFGVGDVEFIIDENGKKLSYKQVTDFRLLTGLGFSAIDTEAFAHH